MMWKKEESIKIGTINWYIWGRGGIHKNKEKESIKIRRMNW